MANPGYPQMGQMGQMPPMGGGPQMPMGQGRPVRRGTSKAVPVVVSAGLAVGVFCGLLFGLGTGKHDAQAATAEGSDGSATMAAPAGLGATAATPVGSAATGSAATGSAESAVAAGSAGSAVPAAGSATSAVATGSAAGSAVPEVKIAKLVVNVKPPEAAAGATITVDGAAITGTSLDMPTEKKTVDVVVKAPGYHSYEHAAPLVGGQTTTLDVELVKRAPEPPHPPAGHPPVHKSKPSGGGLIDI